MPQSINDFSLKLGHSESPGTEMSFACGSAAAADAAPPRQGVKSFWSGSQYDGEMLKGKRHGRGTKQWPNGDMYEGIKPKAKV